MTVDDFWGTLAWEQWAEEIGRVLPPAEYPIFDIPNDHPVLHTLYDVPEVEQVSSIQFWSRSGGSVSERGHDSSRVNIPDTWEREGESREYFDRFSPSGYALGVNIVLYGLTH